MKRKREPIKPRNASGQFSSHAEILRRLNDESFLLQRQTAEKLVALFVKIHELSTIVTNLSKQVQELRAENRAAFRLLLATFKEDLDREQQMAVVKDFLLHKNNPR